MQQSPPFGHNQVVTELIRGVLDVVADKPHLTPERRGALTQTVVCTMMAFNPRDPVETLLAGQCVMYDAMLRDGARDLLRGQAELVKLRARPSLLAAGKMFLATMEMAIRMQGRPAAELAYARPLRAPDETPLATSAESPAEPPAEPPEPPADPPGEAAADALTDPPPAAEPDRADPEPAPETLAATEPEATEGPSEPAATPPAAWPVLSETVDDRLLEGFTPDEQRDIREAVAQAARLAARVGPLAAGQAVPRAAESGPT